MSSCSVESCSKPKFARGWCSAHYARWRATGDPETPFQRNRNTGECSVGGCDSPSRKRGWCASHYAQARCTGRPPEPFAYKWAERVDCLVCGNSTEGFRLRRFCSSACDFLWRKYGGNVPTETPCVACGVAIDLTARGKGGQRIKAHVKFCRRCRQDYNKYKMSVRELAERDGTDCGICGTPVDMSLTREDGLMCPSVDHILPRSRGGTHDPANLQLAHLRCNMVKSDRVEQVPDLIGGGSYE